MTKVLNYIDDGYTLTAYIAAVPGVHDECEIKYRPALPRQRAGIFEAIGKKKAAEAEDIAARSIAEYVKDWDNIRDSAGNEITVSTHAASHLPPKLSHRMFQIVMGNEGGDERPDDSPSETPSAIDDEVERILSGEDDPIEEVTPEKNSEPASA